MGTLITQCAACGKKTLSVLMRDGGICSSCATKAAQEEANRRAQEAKQKAKQKAEAEEAKRLRAEAIYDKIKKRPSLPQKDNILKNGTLADAERYLKACNEIIENLQAAKSNSDFLELYRHLWDSNDLRFPYWNIYYRTENMPIAYLQHGIDHYIKEKEYAEEIIEKTMLVKKFALETPRADIKREPCSYQPDEDPDFAGLKLSNVTASSIRMQLADYIVIDVETTGLSPTKDGIVQIAAVKYESYTPIEIFCTYIKPKGGIKPAAQEINNITEEMVMDAPTVEEVTNSFRSFIGNSLPLVGHNIIFDLRFLCAAGCLSIIPKRKYYDTLNLAKKAFKDCSTPNFKLDTLLRRFLYIVRDDAHDALSDCISTGLLFNSETELITGES